MAGRTAIFVGILINGAAALGLMIFAGHVVATTNRTAWMVGMRLPVAYYICGVWFAAVSTVFLFKAQSLLLSDPRWLRLTLDLTVAALLLISFALFALGSYQVLNPFFRFLGG